MLEKDIENLLAQNPDVFFPESGFKLIGQQVKIGRCFADIIFEDKQKRKVIVEVKRGILTRDASGQVMEYYGLLKNEGPDDFVELILCANVIPAERKKFLETVGIECKELGINEIHQIADKVGYEFINSAKPKEKGLPDPLPVSDRTWIFQANPLRYDIMNALSDEEIGVDIHWLVNKHKNDITKGHIGMIWLSGKESGIYAITQIVTDPQMLEEPEAERKYWTEPADAGGKKLRVKMRIVKNMLKRPLTRETIQQADGLSRLSILIQPQGTNFIVSSDEWNIIKELIAK